MSYSMFGRWAEARNIALRGALVFITLLSAANAATFTAQDASPVTCAGNLTIEKGGVVHCSDGASMLPSCSGDVVIDTKGVIRCPAAVGLPVCTLAAAPSTITLGASSLLTATCNPLASSYVWTGVPTSFGSGAAGLVYPTATTTYTVKGVSSTGQQGVAASKTVTVTASSTPPTTPPSCTLSQQPGQYAGSTYLISSCNPAATSYAWSGNATYNGIACSTSDSNCLVNPSTTSTYSMTPSNAAGTGSAVGITVTKSAVCTLTPSPASIFLGEQSTLTASCNPVAETYTWTGGSCEGTTANPCVVTPASVGGHYYTVVGTAAGTGASAPAAATVTVTPPTCTVTASPSTVGVGGTSILTASCSPATNTFTWTGGTCAGNTTATCTVTPADTTSYVATGTGANTAISAPTTVTVVPPYCTLTANPAAIAPGGSSTLTAYCSPDATAYTWTAPCDTTATGNTCIVSPAVTTSYTVTGTGTNTDASDPVTVSVLPPTCTLTANPTTIVAGGSSTLTASCSPAAASLAWSAPCDTTAVGNSCTVTPAANTTYTVAGTNSAGTGNTASATVSISTTPAGCQVADVTWPAGLAAYGGNGGTPLQTINGGEMKAWRITITSQAARAAMMSYSQCTTHFSVSATACEWGTPALTAANCTTGGVDNSISVQTSDLQPQPAGACEVAPNSVIYFNVRPNSDSVQNCSFYLSY